MTINAFCIHAHFYQPPREDPLTGVVPQESGAVPFPNWNERIHAECYRPNAELGNFNRISFNIGPTLNQWLVAQNPKTLSMIARQDRANADRHGVGNAIAQAYNHTILPLASHRDKVTQVAWGIAEFEFRFGRKPQGMWLPETAVDQDTLAILADQGIQFTILAPWQADQADLDTSEPYRVDLPEGRSIVVFFYNQDLSGGISFDPSLTVNADQFAASVLAPHFQTEKSRRGEPQILMLASDGELYGHHQPQRDLFLSHLLNGAGLSSGLTSTYPGLWLNNHPVRRTVGIQENTSWSCHHGVGRWLGTCPCTPGAGSVSAGGTLSREGNWKAHLRYAFECLTEAIDELYYSALREVISDPWSLRDNYIHVILGQLSAADLVTQAAGRRISEEKTVQARLLLEAQRERQRMYTSCGWFFDDFDRIEPRNNLAYAAQALRLTRLATGHDLEPYALQSLARVVSPRTGLRADSVFHYHMQRLVNDGRILAGD